MTQYYISIFPDQFKHILGNRILHKIYQKDGIYAYDDLSNKFIFFLIEQFCEERNGSNASGGSKIYVDRAARRQEGQQRECIEIRSSNYKNMPSIENYINKLKMTGFVYKLKEVCCYLLNLIMISLGKVQNIYCLNQIDSFEFMKFIEKHNIKHYQYFTYTKFTNDLTISFIRGKHEVLFKLELVDRNELS